MSDLYIGFDTSNYKTSAAVIDSDGNIVYERSDYLEVGHGSRGLRQSEAFFRHSNRLPSFIEEICSCISVSDIRAAGVSSRPRRVEGSYMPCFLAGVNAARELSSVLGIPLHEFSHQEGHAAAVIENRPDVFTCADQPARRSVLFHLSGGTTEFLICCPDDRGYSLEITGGTKDISIGQLIDRAGVAMDYPFPSGAYLDSLAEAYFGENGRIRSDLPVIRINGGYFNLSGIETHVMKRISLCGPDEYPYIAYCIFESTASLLASSALTAASEAGADTVYMAGGVSSSSFIRRSVEEKVQAASGRIPEIVFGEPRLSGDNAVGTARLAMRVNSLHI